MIMKKGVMVGCFCVFLAGRATATKTYAPDGREAYTIECSGVGGSWAMCQAKAGDLCGSKGYDLISTGSDQGAIANIDGSTGNAFATNTISRSMYIACKK
ncbi:TPA: hypothetical protein G7125_004043 [Salmonella enterica subsp. enterica serovar Typhi]|uniref:Lipoprotein n=4 Tax=Salmonella enterica TaxID=28901 RepID=A0A754YFT2_SALPT|nr:hypothetical protein [Salmonella enterica subsp. enterica serovar Paratyphi A]HAE6988220.1 hypothetical protein [Salmonella enterica subsp. enterica serovar Paratyphi A str. ATCC 9150]HAF2991537.1 hypothetical protein [Salmonella enterica subsp. enterica serovar Typhi]HAF0850949.1 hypothetical protein [Salmonella enterica subsp. enterica serovar Paratyphi A]HAF3239756.1 hypothetical protein [Salmonella enterica subsp. enterica serovar Typhi]